eukprot:6304634-Pyramimonas_sp.AAC.1
MAVWSNGSDSNFPSCTCAFLNGLRSREPMSSRDDPVSSKYWSRCHNQSSGSATTDMMQARSPLSVKNFSTLYTLRRNVKWKSHQPFRA